MSKQNGRGPSAIIRERLATCRRAMARQDIGAYLVSRHMDYFYLTGFSGEDSAVLVLPRAVHILSDGRFIDVIKQECPWAQTWMRKGNLNSEIAKACRELKLRRVAVQGDGLTLADHAEVRELNRGTKLTVAPPIITNMRKLKDDADMTHLRKALRVAEDAFEATLKTIRIGQTELEMAARLEYEMKVRGASDPSFPTICAEGSNAALPHAKPGTRKVKSGSAILFDWGARVGMYCSDLTRMVFVDTIPPKFAELYAIVLEAQERAIAAIRPGARMCDVDEVARTCIADAGYGPRFTHGLGHGLGLNVHEAPSLSWRSQEPLQAGMLVTVEPGVYLPGAGGVRIEDDVLVTRSGARVLGRLSKRLEDAVIRGRR
ncbi:MAG: aminopeptidase P family protein [Planctomycetes bacterium]|nr:aminopeptidase P family protein [Planctomycetota bacterium]